MKEGLVVPLGTISLQTRRNVTSISCLTDIVISVKLFTITRTSTSGMKITTLFNVCHFVLFLVKLVLEVKIDHLHITDLILLFHRSCFSCEGQDHSRSTQELLKFADI